MTSNKKPVEEQIPELAQEVAERTTEGIYEIEVPELVNDRIRVPASEVNGGNLGEFVPTIKFQCRSLFAKSPNTVCKCNATVKTLVGRGTGDQTEIISCGKCRTSYIIRQHYDDAGHLDISMSVWDLGRNVQQFCKMKRDKDYKVWVEFNKEKKND